MKKIINTTNILFIFFLCFIASGIISCKKESGSGSKSAPVISRIRTVSKSDTISGVVHQVNFDSTSVYDETTVIAFDSTVTEGRRNNQYAIIGENLQTTTSVSFNGLVAYFNPGLVTDHSIILSVPATAPYGSSQSNKLVVTTLYGSAEYDFPILQPPPSITSFDPLAGSAGDILTIKGSVFDDVSEVRFDSSVAEIISSTTTEIKVKIPEGVVQSYIYVTTPGGTAKSTASYGFISLIYDDAVQNGWGNYFGYGSTRDLQSTTHVKRGSYAIAVTVDNGYGALQIGYGGATLSVSDKGLTAIKFSIYGGDGINTGDKVQVVINGSYGTAVQVDVVPGQYTDYTIPLSQLGNPDTITEFVIQTLGVAAPSTFYVDDIGFI